ncbi:MAG TPA: adenosine deaminase [Longimicrobiaceae bacterium]
MVIDTLPDRSRGRPRPPSIDPDRLRQMPKAELHVHLDGSLRATTMLELAAEQQKPLPRSDARSLRDYMHVTDARNLVEYLERFEVTLSLMQTAESLERIAYELAEDLAGENVRYAEIRYSPLLHTREGLPLTEAVDAPLRGLARAERELGIRTALIICGIRNMDPATSRDLADLTVAYKGRGVVAFDLAGAEYNYPAKKHRDAFYTVINRNMATTIHAGEAYGPESIHQALHYCRANRIGHGTRLYEDPDLMRYVRDFRIPIEICLSSNVQTRAVASYADHPVRRYFDEGIVVSLNTDNRLMSGTTLTEEYRLAHEHLGFSWEELKQVALMAFDAAFLPWDEKQRIIGRVKEEMAAIPSP